MNHQSVISLFPSETERPRPNVLKIRQCEFVDSVFHLDKLPRDRRPQIAFAGRSNVGKSTLLNRLVGHRKMAKVSKSPGKTRSLNFFLVNERFYFVDLPGYGYAKVSAAKQHHWAETLGEYLLSRKSLAGLILLMDIRHPLKEYDRNMVHWCTHAELPVYVILNKSDKLSRGKAVASLLDVKRQLSEFPIEGIQLFSSLKRTGVDDALQQLCHWLELPYSKQ